MVRVFDTGRVISKTQEMLLNTQHYKVHIKDNWRNPRKGVVPSTTPWSRFSWFVGFYGISTFVGYLMPNPFLCK